MKAVVIQAAEGHLKNRDGVVQQGRIDNVPYHYHVRNKGNGGAEGDKLFGAMGESYLLIETRVTSKDAGKETSSF